MKFNFGSFLVWMISSLYLPLAGADLPPARGQVLVPECAGVGPRDAGVRAHTWLRFVVVPDTSVSTLSQYNTPASLRAIYHLPAGGGANAIAIVDAFHYPTALADFNFFSGYFGLPKETSTAATGANNKMFQVVYAPGYQPQSGGNYIESWNLEAALDIEWAHAMAPNAKIYLVEARSDSFSDLTSAVEVASSLPGVKEVSMSWGSSEVSYEAIMGDPLFTKPGVVYLASGGDTSDLMSYPAASPNVVSCGGTTVNRNSKGVFVSESGWNDTGCGPSAYEPRPAFQSKVAAVVGNKRGVSDLAFDADPDTGVYVYDSTPVWGTSGWQVLGGTSVSSPSLAGVLNLAASSGNGFAANTAAEEARIYGSLGNAKAFNDVTSGTDGKYKCAVGYDFVTGVGSPYGVTGK